MKRALKVLFVIGAVGFVIALIRNRVAPRPEAPLHTPPPFRPGHAPPPPSTPAAAPGGPPAPAAPPRTDDLTEVKGIGPVYSERLNSEGISSFASLANADPAVVASALEVSETAVADWQAQARRLLD